MDKEQEKIYLRFKLIYKIIEVVFFISYIYMGIRCIFYAPTISNLSIFFLFFTIYILLDILEIRVLSKIKSIIPIYRKT
jgi:hypothetical protein